MINDPDRNSTLENVENAVTNVTAARDKILEWGNGDDTIPDVLDDLLLASKDMEAARKKLLGLYRRAAR